MTWGGLGEMGTGERRRRAMKESCVCDVVRSVWTAERKMRMKSGVVDVGQRSKDVSWIGAAG